MTAEPVQDEHQDDAQELSQEQAAAFIRSAIEQAEATGQPVLLGRGLYSLYSTPEGGMHLAYRPEGIEEDQHLPLPATIVRMFLARNEGGGPAATMKAMMGF